MAAKFYYKLETELIDNSEEIKLPNFTRTILTPSEIFSNKQKHLKGREIVQYSSPENFSNSSSLADLLTPLSLTPLSPHSIGLGASYESGGECNDEIEKLRFFGVNFEGIGLCSITTGSQHVEQFAIPLPKAHLRNFQLLTDAKITACCLLGESQVWIGTDTGSLHFLSLFPDDMSVLSHRTVQLTKPITAICVKPVKSLVNKTDVCVVRYVYVALESGCLLEFSGIANSTGGINPMERGNKYIYLVRTMSDIEIHCLAYQHQTDFLLVGLTSQIKVIKRSDTGYKDHKSLKIDTQLPPNSYVSSIIQSEAGIWASFAHAPFVILWDSISLLRKSCVSLCNLSKELSYGDDIKITCVFVCQNYIFLATKGGHVIVYRCEDGIDNNWEYTASTHCAYGEITDLYVQAIDTVIHTELVSMNIYICCCDLNKMLNSSFIALRFRKLKQKPVSKRLSNSDIRERYQNSQTVCLETVSTSPKHPKLSLIAFNETHTHSFLPLVENRLN